jgi:hypothetical protein
MTANASRITGAKVESVIGRVDDRWGRTIQLTAADWSHVIDRHPELVTERPLILATISFPDIVTQDADYGDRENFYRVIDWSIGGKPRRSLKVCVQYEARGGKVVTTFRCPRIKRAEPQRWP